MTNVNPNGRLSTKRVKRILSGSTKIEFAEVSESELGGCRRTKATFSRSVHGVDLPIGRPEIHRNAREGQGVSPILIYRQFGQLAASETPKNGPQRCCTRHSPIETVGSF
jgi:hypothetical protein